MQPYELFIGLRYTRAKRRNHFISFISLASMLGIALGITALITVMSVMNGFQKEVRARILGVASHIVVQGDDRGLADWRAIMDQTKQHSRVVGAAPFVNGQGLLAAGANVRGALIRGVSLTEEGQVSELPQQIKLGAWENLKPGEFGVILGVDLARALRISVGERVTMITPKGQVTPAGLLPRMRSLTVVGVFAAGHYEFDSTLALMHLADAQKLFQLEDKVSGIRLKVDDIFAAPQVSRELAKTITVDAFLLDWTRQNVNYFRAVEIEKRMMFIILTLIIAVAAFNLVSTLVMVVTDKHPDIAILRTLGASPGSIMKIFIVQGVVIGVIGTALGVIGGLLLAANIDVIVPAIERAFNFQILSKEVYYISEIPSHILAPDVIWVAVVSLVLSFVATLYPSWRASKVNPAEALRYE
jgi:lipoprotein-releasing system permease protein